MKISRKKVAKRHRNEQGMTSILIAIIAIFVLLPLGLFAFEMARVYLAQAQLRVCTDSAALAVQTAIASSGSPDTETTRQKSNQIALQLMHGNTVVGNDLSNAALTDQDIESLNPKAGETFLECQFNPSDKTVTAKATMGLKTVFGSFLGISSLPIHAASTAGAGKLDVVVVLDISHSMTVASKLARIRRTFDTATGKTIYEVRSRFQRERGPNGLPAFPQHLSDANFALRGADPGPPGNLNRPNMEISGYTHLIPDPAQMKPELMQESPFFSVVANAPEAIKIAALVEAQAGNLESQQLFDSSKASTTALANFITPKAGFQKEYDRLARKSMEPFASANGAVDELIRGLNTIADPHMGLVAFAGKAGGERNTDNFRIFRINSHDTPGGPKDFYRIPKIDLSKSDRQVDEVLDAVENVTSFHGTDTRHALKAAFKMFTPEKSRDEARKIVILLTDGVPTGGHPTPIGQYPSHVGGTQEANISSCLETAKQFRAKGIPIYSIGFFHQKLARKLGKSFLTKLTSKASGESKLLFANDIEQLTASLRQLRRELVCLVR